MNDSGRQCHRPGDRGSALLASLCFATVLAVALGSYITVCYRTLDLSTRTLRGLHNLTLAESGLEEALWALNHNDWSGWSVSGSTATRALDGFSFDGGVSGTVSVKVTNYNVANVPREVTVSGATQKEDGAPQIRTVTSVADRAPLFVNAVAATTGRVRFRLGGTVDSYDSTLGDYAVQAPGYSAVLSSGSASDLAATVQLGSAQVKGFVATLGTGPSYSTGAALGGPGTFAAGRIDSTRISTSPYQPLFDEAVPGGSGSLLPAGTATIGTPGAAVPSLFYSMGVELAGTDVLTINGPVVLVVRGDFTITELARIVITTQGSLRIHLQGDLAINGGGIQNDTRLPRKLVIIATTNLYETYGMATLTPFHGVIYTPVSSFTVSYNQAIHGAIVARSVTFLGSPAFHYDVSLRRTVIEGVVSPFGVGNWRETHDGV